jgi:uncharacterized membrane protein YqjE
MFEFNQVLLLLQQMSVYLVIAYLLSKTPLFIPLMQATIRLSHKLLCYVIFSVFCIMGTYFGLHNSVLHRQHARHRCRIGWGIAPRYTLRGKPTTQQRIQMDAVR